MSNRIVSVSLRDHSLIPAQAEVHVTVVPDFVDATTEVRGRLMGPRCQFASTIEVAYHLRPLAAKGEGAITMRAIIPEASLWEPQSPHLYGGPVELWQDGQRREVIQVRHGLRRVALGSRGLHLNGRQIQLRGREANALDDDAALSLRTAGYNLVVAPVEEATKAIWEVADRIGLFVLGRVAGETDLTRQLAAHPSCLGWLTGDEGILSVQAASRFRALANTVNGTNGDRAGLILTAPDGPSAEATFGVVEGGEG